MAISAPAFGQQKQPEAEAPSVNADDIVVTGTLIRGVAPAGTNVISVSAEKVQETGATTVSQLLQTLPQFGSFNSLQVVNGGGNFLTTNRPNLRDLPGFTTTGTSTTLLLIDGRRMVGMGISSTTPDADFVPPGIIERVEVVPDGGSALYGSDAVAGVVNFITRKRFDGVMADARYGFADDYHTFDANVTVGKDWGSGSIFASYNYTENDQIFGIDRDFNFTPQSSVAGTVVTSLNCRTPNILVGGTAPRALYASTSSAAGTANVCDISDEATFVPSMKRHSVYAGLVQQLNDWLELDIKAFYYNKHTELSQGAFDDGSVTIGGPATTAQKYPGFVSITGLPGETQQVSFALGPKSADYQRISLESWGVTQALRADLGGGWQLRGHGSYGESLAISVNDRYNSALINSLTTSGAFNPYNPMASSPAALAQLFDWETYGYAKQRQFNARIIADGTLFALPGGDAKVAIGAEYTDEGFISRRGNVRPSQRDTIKRNVLGRNVWAVFGELVAPVFGGGDGPSLTVSASGRYDKYSDVGSTFNPKFGATFKPVDWISIRAAWGKSFVAPSLSDDSLADPTNLNWVSGGTVGFLAPPGVPTANGYREPNPGEYIVFLLGTNDGLKPQKATTWSLGIDIEPPVVPGLRLSTTYFNIDYKDLISGVPFAGVAQLFFSTYAQTQFTVDPTQVEINAAVADAVLTTGVACSPQPDCVYAIMDVRKQNLGGFRQSGLDFSASYTTRTGFGSLDFNMGGTYTLTRANQPRTGAAFVSETNSNLSLLKLRTSVGTNIGNLRAQVTWSYLQGFTRSPPAGLVAQTHVGDFNVFDLFFKYDLSGEGMGKDLAFTLNVNNVFDQDPPIFYGGDIVPSRVGFTNGSTLGRLVQFGVSKKF